MISTNGQRVLCSHEKFFDGLFIFFILASLTACSSPDAVNDKIIKDPYPLIKEHLCEPSEQGEAKQLALDLFKEAEQLRAKGDDINSVPIWRNIIEIDPNFNCAIYELAQALRRIGEYDDAIHHYDSAIGKGPTPWYYFYSRGAAKYLAGYYQDAVIDLSPAIALNPGEPTIYDLRADSKIMQNNYIGAFDDIELAIAKGGLYPKVLKTRGILYAMRKEWNHACSDWQTIISNYNQSNEHKAANDLLREYC